TTGNVTGRPTAANSSVNNTIANTKFAIGPAATTIARDSTDFSWNVSPRLQLARTSAVTSSGRSWPCSLTYPPSGSQASFQTVSWLSTHPVMALPNPMENTSTCTP